MREQGVPERVVLKHIEHPRNTDGATGGHRQLSWDDRLTTWGQDGALSAKLGRCGMLG